MAPSKLGPCFALGMLAAAAAWGAAGAAIPGWSGIDYRSGSTGAGEFWLKQTKLSTKAFADYRQTLNQRYDVVVSGDAAGKVRLKRTQRPL